jgi:hypothetical protein
MSSHFNKDFGRNTVEKYIGSSTPYSLRFTQSHISSLMLSKIVTV